MKKFLLTLCAIALTVSGVKAQDEVSEPAQTAANETFIFQDIVNEQDQWFSICVPFDMSIRQIKAVFGDETQVCKFSSVHRHWENKGNNGERVLRINFRYSVMNEYPFYDDSGIEAHQPYMIKPSGRYTVPTTTDENGRLVRTFEGCFIQKGNPKPNNIIVPDKNIIQTYTFIGTYEKTDLPNGTYYLGRAWNEETEEYEHRFGFFYGDAKTGKGKWNAYTAVVRVGKAEEEYKEFFKGKNTPVYSFYNNEGYDEMETDAVEKVSIECGEDYTNCKVYSISGTLVGTNLDEMPKGIYIVNNKKVIKK